MTIRRLNRPARNRHTQEVRSISINPKYLRILVVEDYNDIRHLLEEVLAHKGHWVEGLYGPGTALERMKQDGFDLLLTDVWQPNLAGWDFLDELRTHERLPAYVVSMSEMYGDEARRTSKAAGCFAHLVQPFKLEELEAILDDIMSRRQAAAN